jgi:hypothetical protein
VRIVCEKKESRSSAVLFKSTSHSEYSEYVSYNEVLILLNY